jgi:probable phosphoglycerate mutase
VPRVADGMYRGRRYEDDQCGSLSPELAGPPSAWLCVAGCACSPARYATGVVITHEEPSRPAATFRQTQFPSFPGTTEILLIRHGESEPYVQGHPFPLADGHGDPALSPEGTAQAERLAERLAVDGVDAIYVSTLRRTSQTAAPLARRLGLTPCVEADLREAYLGEWEGGIYRQRVAEGDPLVLKCWTEERWDVIPGAEAADAFADRVRGVIERLVAGHPDQRVAVFTHGGVIGQVLAIATRSRPFAFIAADNASVSRLAVVGDQWIVRSYNDTAHLGPK